MGGFAVRTYHKMDANGEVAYYQVMLVDAVLVKDNFLIVDYATYALTLA